MISRALLNAPFFIPKDADLLRNRKVNTKKRQNRHLPELAFLILGTYFTAPIILYFFTSDNADETFKFGIFQYHCSVFFTRQGTVSILFVRIFPCYSIIISLIEIFLIFSEYIYIIIS